MSSNYNQITKNNFPVYHGIRAKVELIVRPKDSDGEKTIHVALAQSISISRQIDVKVEREIGSNGEPIALIPNSITYTAELNALAFDSEDYAILEYINGFHEDDSNVTNRLAYFLVPSSRAKGINTFDIVVTFYKPSSDGNELDSTTLKLINCVPTNITRNVEYNQYVVDRFSVVFTNLEKL